MAALGDSTGHMAALESCKCLSGLQSLLWRLGEAYKGVACHVQAKRGAC